jgi:hypothetical protein
MAKLEKLGICVFNKFLLLQIHQLVQIDLPTYVEPPKNLLCTNDISEQSRVIK